MCKLIIGLITLFSISAFANELDPKEICESGALQSSNAQVRDFASNYCKKAETIELATCMAGALQSSDKLVRDYAANYCRKAETLEQATCMAEELQSTEANHRYYAANYCR